MRTEVFFPSPCMNADFPYFFSYRFAYQCLSVRYLVAVGAVCLSCNKHPVQYLMLVSPCMYNNPLYELFVLSLLSYHTSACFGLINSLSSVGRMYICGKWYWLYFWDCQRVCWQSTVEYSKYHLPHTYILPPDDGLLISPKDVEVWKFNKLRINSAYSWLLYIYSYLIQYRPLSVCNLSSTVKYAIYPQWTSTLLVGIDGFTWSNILSIFYGFPAFL
jgi:hypothetical protein